jgi:hypothetical protein
MKGHDQLTMTEKKKATDLILRLVDILTTQEQELEYCTLEQVQINVIEAMRVHAATPYRSTRVE